MLTKQDIEDRLQLLYKDFINLENVSYYIEFSNNNEEATVYITTNFKDKEPLVQRAYFEERKGDNGEKRCYLLSDWNE